MNKSIIAVYQDCVLCGDKGRKKALELAKKGVNIRKVGFATPEGKKLCREAVFDYGIKTMPFYTDGEKYSANLDELLKKPKKTTRKTKKVETEVVDGTDSES